MLPGKTYNPEVLLALAKRYRHMIAGAALVGAVAGVAYGLWLPNRYRSETLILVVPQRVPETFVRSTVTTPIQDRLRSLTQQIMSRTRLERVVEDFDLYSGQRGRVPMEDIIEGMRGQIGIETIRGDTFRLSFVSDDPQLAMKVTQRLATLFIDENLQDRTMMAEGTNQFLESQLEDARGRLLEHEKKLEGFRRRYAGQLPEQLQSNLQVMQNTQLQISQLQESVNRDRDRKLMLERQFADVQSGAYRPSESSRVPVGDRSGATLPAGATAAQQLTAAQDQLRQLELRLKPQHPDIVRQQRLIQELEAKAAGEALAQPLAPGAPPETPSDPELAKRASDLRGEIQNVDRQITYKTAEETRLREVLLGYQSRIEAVPGLQSEMTELMRDYDTLREQYTGLLRKNEESKIAANLERRSGGEQFRILDPARVPERPFTPDRGLVAASGLAVGLGLGLGLIAFLEFRDRTLRTEQDVIMVLTLPVLASIPVITTTAERNRVRQMYLMASAGIGTFLLLSVFAMWKLLPWQRVLERLR